MQTSNSLWLFLTSCITHQKLYNKNHQETSHPEYWGTNKPPDYLGLTCSPDALGTI